MGRKQSSYVFTTTNPKAAMRLATSGDYYLHEIHTTGNFFGVYDTLVRDSNMCYRAAIRRPFCYAPWDDEVVALGGIRWDQIIRSAKVRKDAAGIVKIYRWKKNSDYALEKYKNARASAGQPQLAGFEPDDPAWKEEVWKAFKDIPVQKSAAEFMDKNGKLVDWTGKAPLLPMRGTHYAVGNSIFYLDAYGTNYPVDLSQTHGAPTEQGDRKKDSDALGNPCEDGKRAVFRRGAITCVDRGEKTSSKQPKGGDVATMNGKTEDGDAGRVEPLAETELLKKSDEFAEEEFGRLTAKFGLAPLLKDVPLSFSNIRSSLKGYKPLVPKNVKLSAGNVGAGLGAAVWVKDIVDVFAKNSSSMEKAVVLTSIVPLAGCGVQAAADTQQGTSSAVDTSLCVVGDALLLSPAWPVGLAVQIVRDLIKIVPQAIAIDKEFTALKDPKILNQRRIDGWTKQRDMIVANLTSDAFMERAKKQFASEQVAVLFAASRVAGGLRAGSLQAAATQDQRKQLQHSTDFAGQPALEKQMCDEISRRKDRLVADFSKEVLVLMALKRDEFDNEFFGRYIRWAIRNQPRSFYNIPSKPWIRKYAHQVWAKNRLVSIPPKTFEDFKGKLGKLEMPEPCRRNANRKA
ncbi:ureidoglycolate hydrolase [Purpureocillium lavendulum]|uniref:Ureidoglycolate hydrolase n=1 Tax=Purpureocillium lavendulum TaxID=1247861 RepID=A0AB34FVI1_9HYPO|nr:ureidoglycolate hydrolase [Purpureocillium lavendulum]